MSTGKRTSSFRSDKSRAAYLRSRRKVVAAANDWPVGCTGSLPRQLLPRPHPLLGPRYRKLNWVQSPHSRTPPRAPLPDLQLCPPQPIHGAHPGQSGSSALGYMLGHVSTIPGDRGIFLSLTRRLRPLICNYVSRVRLRRALSIDNPAARQRLLLSRSHSALAPARLSIAAIAHAIRGGRSRSGRLSNTDRSDVPGSQWQSAPHRRHRYSGGHALQCAGQSLDAHAAGRREDRQ